MFHERSRTFFGLLFVIAFALAFGTLFVNFQFDRAIERERTTVGALERELGAVDVALSDLKAAQHAYFAPEGQQHDFWRRRASELLTRLDTMLAGLRDTASTPDARNRFQAAATAVAALADLDSRAREDLANGQSALAADLVFTDGVEGAQRARTELTEAENAETRAAADRIARLEHLRLGIDGGAFALLLVLLLILISARAAPRPQAASPASLTAQMIRDLPPPVKPATASASVAKPVTSPPVPSQPPQPQPAPVSLLDAAELCMDLARVVDARDVPALVERAAQLLDAKGVILWAPEPGASVLRPSLTHGYSSRVVARLGSLDVAADNVTSLCFRSMRPQVMPGASAESSGAIAVPLITATGCAGVLAAEVRDSRPSQDLVAITKIIGAQFAVLVGPADGQTRNAAEA